MVVFRDLENLNFFLKNSGIKNSGQITFLIFFHVYTLHIQIYLYIYVLFISNNNYNNRQSMKVR